MRTNFGRHGSKMIFRTVNLSFLKRLRNRQVHQLLRVGEGVKFEGLGTVWERFGNGWWTVGGRDGHGRWVETFQK